MKRDAEMAALEKSLRRRFRVVETSVEVGGRELSILHPASAEDLINEVDFERDERLPYWAELWPSSRVLGARMLDMTGAGRSLLELGCGSGIVTTCAALAGFDVVASDYYEDALRFARLNAWRNEGRPVRGLMLDWRDIPATLGRFDVVIASDVLYERPYGALVARVMSEALSEDGTGWLADPGRVGREGFIESLAMNGLAVRSRAELPFVEGPIKQSIGLFEIARTT